MNIPGVEILHSSKYVVGSDWGWTPINWVLVGIAIIAIFSIFLGCYYKDMRNLIMGSISLIGCIILILSFSSAGKTLYGTEYNVIINDDTALTEIANKYQINNVNGKLYTLRPYNIVPWEGD